MKTSVKLVVLISAILIFALIIILEWGFRDIAPGLPAEAPADLTQIPEDAVPLNKTYSDKIILPVQFFSQDQTGCSRNAFAMAMNYYDNSITSETIAEEAPRFADNGSPNGLLIILAEKFGFKTRTYPGSIENIIQNIAVGRPVIVAQYPSLTGKSTNHDRVAIGYDQTKKEIIVHDSAAGANISYSYADFLKLWEADFAFKPGGGIGDEKYYSVLITNEAREISAARNITIDGYAPDWLGMNSVSSDRKDDCDASDLSFNIKRMYAYKDSEYLYLMVVFADVPKKDANISYYFDFYYYSKNKTIHLMQPNFRFSYEPWVQFDYGKSYKTLKNTQWKIGRVFETKIGLENFADLPDYVSIRAGTYDFAGAKFIDQSYANAYKIR